METAMAGIRGAKNPFPTKGKAPTGIFSTRGSQKMDSTERFQHKDVMKYAKACSHTGGKSSKSAKSGY